MPQDNIADPTKPSAGRMYDYFLGGNHNFEVDRQAADQVLQLMPFSAKYCRFQRWALQDIAIELAETRGYDVIIDFASGLPTNDHIHLKVPQGTTVIYSDIDPVVVEYAHEILQNTPNVYFFQGDARKPEELLKRPEVEKILAGRRKVAFVLWGVTTFLSDEEIQYAMHSLYEWAVPGTCLAFCAQGVDIDPQNPEAARVLKIYEQMGTPLRCRTIDQFIKLVEPWKFDGKGFISLLEWHGFDNSIMSKEDIESCGPMGGVFGTYLIK